MEEVRCRYCDYYLFSAIGKDTKIRITCKRCKRNQVVDIAVKTRVPDHLQAAGMS